MITAPPSTQARAGWLRLVVELLTCLSILVVLFRSVLACTYMIETGSMAPCLLGKHRQAVCPSCRFSFAVEGNGSLPGAVCPNCGHDRIAVKSLPEKDGDQLLVHRETYAARRPRRWEVIVFQNPNKPQQAYVKRLIALPGETVQICEGDVYVSGQIEAKSYATQRGLRIPVYDHDFRPPDDDPEWRPRWVIDRPNGHWNAAAGAFRYAPVKGSQAPSDFEWVHYRNWVRSGGFHATSVPLADWPADSDSLQGGFGPLRYDEKRKTLVCRGAMPAELRDRLLGAMTDRKSRQAIERLYEASHIAPIVDAYGYNSGRDGQGRHEVRDLMLEYQLIVHAGQGEFAMSITDGRAEYQCTFDPTAQTVRLIDVLSGKVLRTAPWTASSGSRPIRVELSLMDKQVLLALDGTLPFEPWSDSNRSDPSDRGPGSTPWQPVRFGSRGLAVEVSGIKLFRDVYYTNDLGRRGVEQPTKLKSNEFFVLGDNSPVSRDSRSWTDKTVLTEDLLLGKPLVVHLPSQKQRIRLGSWQTEIRIPEISRIRYIY